VQSVIYSAQYKLRMKLHTTMTPRMVEDRHWTGSGPENLTVDQHVDLQQSMDVQQHNYMSFRT